MNILFLLSWCVSEREVRWCSEMMLFSGENESCLSSGCLTSQQNAQCTPGTGLLRQFHYSSAVLRSKLQVTFYITQYNILNLDQLDTSTHPTSKQSCMVATKVSVFKSVVWLDGVVINGFSTLSEPVMDTGFQKPLEPADEENPSRVERDGTGYGRTPTNEIPLICEQVHGCSGGNIQISTHFLCLP